VTLATDSKCQLSHAPQHSPCWCHTRQLLLEGGLKRRTVLNCHCTLKQGTLKQVGCRSLHA
jgi:hypothetical protein